MLTTSRPPLWTVEELGRKRWSFTVRAHSKAEALRRAKDAGFTEPATVKRVEEASHAMRDL